MKSDIYRDSLPLLSSRQIELLDLPRLHLQLCSLERRTARGGRDSIDHPPNTHDDIANSVCGALLLAKKRPGMTTQHFGIENTLAVWRNGSLESVGGPDSKRARGEL